MGHAADSASPNPVEQPSGHVHAGDGAVFGAGEEAALALHGLFWKTRTLADYAAGRPFAWVDDQITMAGWRWCATRHPASALLQHVNPARGLTTGGFAALDRWARLNQQADPAPAEGAMP